MLQNEEMKNWTEDLVPAEHSKNGVSSLTNDMGLLKENDEGFQDF